MYIVWKTNGFYKEENSELMDKGGNMTGHRRGE